jgi:ATP-dependent RNA helicase DeaD
MESLITTSYELQSFEDFGALPNLLQQNLSAQGIEIPTPIQRAAIAPALAGRDVLAQSQTGTGKTLAFTLPIGVRLSKPSEHGRPRALVLTPTRELATQVESVFATTLACLGLRCMTVIGGDSYFNQKKNLKRGIDVVVGTPGRVVDLIRQSDLKLDDIECFVLDEVDQMLDIGFADELAEVYEALPDNTQTLFFSATINLRIRRLAQKLLTEPSEFTISPHLLSPESIVHLYIAVKNGQELPALINALLYHSPAQALIFCETRQDCRDIATSLEMRGLNVSFLNSDLSQDARHDTLTRFREGDIQYLVATNVAARGLDIQSLPLVINYEVAFDVESYTHRTGRTGRAGEEGCAWTIVTPRKFQRYQFQMRQLGLQPKRLDVPSRQDILSRIAEREIAELYRSGGDEVTRSVRRVADKIMERLSPEESQFLLRSFLLRHLTESNTYDTSNIEAQDSELRPPPIRRDRDRDRDRNQRRTQTHSNSSTSTKKQHAQKQHNADANPPSPRHARKQHNADANPPSLSKQQSPIQKIRSENRATGRTKEQIQNKTKKIQRNQRQSA